MRIGWLHTALRSLDDEDNCIATDGPTAARFVVESVLAPLAMLHDQLAPGRSGRVPRPAGRPICVCSTHFARVCGAGGEAWTESRRW
jgi:hypothetical protein